jgi:post-segregation antitoxin (ccd killing protein)
MKQKRKQRYVVPLKVTVAERLPEVAQKLGFNPKGRQNGE